LKSEALAVLPTENTTPELNATAVNTAPPGGTGEKHMNVYQSLMAVQITYILSKPDTI